MFALWRPFSAEEVKSVSVDGLIFSPSNFAPLMGLTVQSIQ